MQLRGTGLLAHPTSLPGPHGIGDLGPSAVRFLDWASEAGQSAWQFLPVAPAGGGFSPYSSPSSHAGNPLLISLELLEQEGWLPGGALPAPTPSPGGAVAFESVAPWKLRWLRRSWDRFRRHAGRSARRDLEAFADHAEQRAWLGDWALYAALKERFEGRPWSQWDRDLRLRRPEALRAAERELAEATAFHRYVQFVFFRQWAALRREATRRGLQLIGDVPFYVAYDSADVWAAPRLFALDDEGRPLQIAGVPPDYFSETGQLWGNPLYRWDRLARDGFAWWIDRLRASLRTADVVRLDHFRGFAAYWAVDASADSAIDGRWVPGPGRALFDACRAALGDLPFVAEDLGDIDDAVHELRRGLGLPCMRVLQFGLADGEGEHAPENIESDALVYTGTHDNDTTRGWFLGLDAAARGRVLERLHADEENVAWRMIETAYGTAAALAVVPLQDVFEVGSEARMNRPGLSAGNWRWRAEASQFTLHRATRLRELAERYGRSR